MSRSLYRKLCLGFEGLGVMRMDWRHVLFLNYRYEPGVLETVVPEYLELDTFDGDAYVSVVAFVMENVAPRGSPVSLSFPEINLRTYVKGSRGDGIYFFSLDATDPLGVFLGRNVYHLPYSLAEISVKRWTLKGKGVSEKLKPSVRTDGHNGDEDLLDWEVEYRSERDGCEGAFDSTYSARGGYLENDSLDDWLTERYGFYTDDRRFCGVEHQPWRLQEGSHELRENNLFEINGVPEAESECFAHYSPGVEVTAGPPVRV
ncbi:MAG: YqjF family protein [Halobacteria archaeon]